MPLVTAELINGRGEITHPELSPQVRAEMFMAEFREMAESSGLMREIHAAIQRGLKCRTTLRAPDPSARNGWSYVWVDDGAVQQTAARTALAYLAGNPPTQADIRVSGMTAPSDGGRATIGDRLAELRAIGVTMESIAEVIRRETDGAMVDVTPGRPVA